MADSGVDFGERKEVILKFFFPTLKFQANKRFKPEGGKKFNFQDNHCNS